MPSNDERREVAARLRTIDDTEWTHLRDELRALDEAIGTSHGMPYAIQATWERLADLIEPEPERICNLIKHGTLNDCSGLACWSCSECSFGWHHSINDKQFSYCPNCGAKVVE